MKRSEAVKLLVDTLGCFDGWKEQVDYMLEQLEAAGMAPPFSNEVFQKNAKIYIEPSGREWEPEDEK